MNESQRAMVGARLATLEVGANQHREQGPPIGGPSISAEEASSTLNVSPRSIERARVVLREGGPELVAKVDAGEMKVSAAAWCGSLALWMPNARIHGATLPHAHRSALGV